MFKEEKKTTEGNWPKSIGSYIEIGDQLKIVYLKFSAEEPIPHNTTKVNLILAHGTGMNKSLWRPHIKKWFEKSKQSKTWKIGNIVSVDAFSHGDSGLANRGKLAWGDDWRDGAKDLIKVVKHEISTTGDFTPSSYTRNILIGHSMGGFHVTFAAFLEPSLFDSCVAIEPVIHIPEGVDELFLKRMQKMKKILKDEFANRNDAERFFRKESFYNVLHPDVLDAMIADELYEENGKIKTKATVDAQYASYLSAIHSIKFGMNILQLLEIPYFFITGKDASWNTPMSVEYVEEAVPAHLLQRGYIDGDHLAHGSSVQETVDKIYDFAAERANFVEQHRDEYPQVKFKNNKASLVKSMFEHMWTGDFTKTFLYDKPQPKL